MAWSCYPTGQFSRREGSGDGSGDTIPIIVHHMKS